MGTKVKEKDLTTDSGVASTQPQIDGEPARARILDAAFAAFSERGYAQTSMLEIATRAKVSKRELYALVGNKDDMLAACISDRAGRLHLPADGPVPTDRRSLEAALLAFGERLVVELSQPAVIGVFRLAIAEAERAPEIAQTLDRVARSAVRAELRRVLEAACERGLLTGEPAPMVRLFMALLWDDLLVNLLLRTAEPPAPAEAADRARDSVAGLLQQYSTGNTGIAMTAPNSPFPWPEERIAHYTALRAPEPLVVDGDLSKPAWQAAQRSPRFVDLVNGQPTVHDTRAAVLWDDDYLYVGFWVEEPFVEAKLTERDALIWSENDVELFIAGQDAYYELEINALGTIYEALFVFEDAYERNSYARLPELARTAEGATPWNGVGFKTHPRGPRLGFFKWDLPGLRSAVRVDGTLNDDSDRDRGWTVEIAVPWSGMQLLAQGDDRALPPRDGDTWRMDFSRFNTYKAAPPADDPGGWAWSAHGIWDSHIPELFPYIHFSTDEVGTAG